MPSFSLKQFNNQKDFLEVNAKDSIYDLPPITWRILGATVNNNLDISLSSDIVKLLIHEKTDVTNIFEPDLSWIDPEHRCAEAPLMILNTHFKNLPQAKQDHYKVLALLANNYQGDFATALLKATYTEEDIEQVRLELGQLCPKPYPSSPLNLIYS